MSKKNIFLLKTVNVICTGKWVPVGGGPGPGTPPPILYCDAINKGKFPDHIEWLSPTRKIYIPPGDRVNLKKSIAGCSGALTEVVVVCEVTIDNFWAIAADQYGYKALIQANGKALIDDNTGSLTAHIWWNINYVTPNNEAFGLDVINGVWAIPATRQIYKSSSYTLVYTKVNLEVTYNIHGLTLKESKQTEVKKWSP